MATIGLKESLSHKLVFYPTNVGKEIIEKGKLNRLNMVLIIGTALAQNTLVWLNSYCSLKHYCSAVYHGY